MVNIIWGIFIAAGIIYSFITKQTDIINQVILDSTKTTMDIIMKILPVMALWLGIMKIASVSGLLEKISRLFSPILKYIFPDIPKGHESLSLIATSIIVNMVGLGNAATPFGLKAMQSLQTLNEKKDTATRSMVTLMVLTTTGFTLVPTTIIALRMTYHSISPMEIISAIIISSLIATLAGLLLDRLIAGRH